MIDRFCPLHMLILVGDFLHFHLLFNLGGGEVLSSPPPDWCPSGTCPCLVSRRQLISSRIFKNHCSFIHEQFHFSWKRQKRQRQRKTIIKRDTKPISKIYPSSDYRFPPVVTCSKRSGWSQVSAQTDKGALRSHKNMNYMSKLSIFVTWRVIPNGLF